MSFKPTPKANMESLELALTYSSRSWNLLPTVLLNRETDPAVPSSSVFVWELERDHTLSTNKLGGVSKWLDKDCTRYAFVETAFAVRFTLLMKALFLITKTSYTR